MRWRPIVAIALVSGCAAVSTELETATALYDDAEYEAAERWLDELEPEAMQMTRNQQARFYYLRGMTAYRLGQRQDALHFLPLATVASTLGGGPRRPERRSILERTLRELTPVTATAHARDAH